MGKIRQYPPVKLFIGFIFRDESVFNKALAISLRSFGEVDFESPSLDFSFTDYYEEEMGQGLKKRFVSFKKLFPLKDLARIKTITNKIEEKLSRSGKRTVNIDPGYLDLAKVSLASTKDFYHRIYIGPGIFAEVTLFYKDKTYADFDWTYPDYKSKAYQDFFRKVREIYASQIKDNQKHRR